MVLVLEHNTIESYDLQSDNSGKIHINWNIVDSILLPLHEILLSFQKYANLNIDLSNIFLIEAHYLNFFPPFVISQFCGSFLALGSFIKRVLWWVFIQMLNSSQFFNSLLAYKLWIWSWGSEYWFQGSLKGKTYSLHQIIEGFPWITKFHNNQSRF